MTDPNPLVAQLRDLARDLQESSFTSIRQNNHLHAKDAHEAADSIERLTQECGAKDAEWKLQEELKDKALAQVDRLRSELESVRQEWGLDQAMRMATEIRLRAALEQIATKESFAHIMRSIAREALANDREPAECPTCHRPRSQKVTICSNPFHLRHATPEGS